MMERWRVLLIGDVASSEFCDARAWLASQTELHAVESFAVAAASLLSQSIPLPDVVVVCQTRPGQFTATQLEDVYRLAPLARMVALLGSLCEGEPRSGKPWPGVIRVYWYDWRPRFELEFGQKVARRWAYWELSRTSTDVDATLYAAAPTHRNIYLSNQYALKTSPVVGIRAQNASTLQGLADVCQSFGYRSMSVPDHPPISPAVDLLVWDGDSLDEPDGAKLTEACRGISPTPVLALLGFPRSQDFQRAATAGVRAILAKPFRLDDLCWHLNSLMSENSLLRKFA